MKLRNFTMVAILVGILSIFTVSTATAQTDFWQQSNGPFGGRITSFGINNQGHIFVGTYCGAWRSTDKGETWVEVNNGLNFLSISTLAINDEGQVFAGTADGVFRSDDNGDSWKAILRGFRTSSLILDKDGQVFAGTSTGSGVSRSTDNGNTWTHSAAGLPGGMAFSFVINQ